MRDAVAHLPGTDHGHTFGHLSYLRFELTRRVDRARRKEPHAPAIMVSAAGKPASGPHAPPVAQSGPRINITVVGRLERQAAHRDVKDDRHRPVPGEVRHPRGVQAPRREQNGAEKDPGERDERDRLGRRARVEHVQQAERELVASDRPRPAPRARAAPRGCSRATASSSASAAGSEHAARRDAPHRPGAASAPGMSRSQCSAISAHVGTPIANAPMREAEPDQRGPRGVARRARRRSTAACRSTRTWTAVADEQRDRAIDASDPHVAAARRPTRQTSASNEAEHDRRDQRRRRRATTTKSDDPPKAHEAPRRAYRDRARSSARAATRPADR